MTKTYSAMKPNDAQTLWVLGSQVRFMGAVDGANLHVLDVVVPPGSATPPHRHTVIGRVMESCKRHGIEVLNGP